ncbi:MAG: ABC transporter ATP-binding protein [Armatimonadota bacterium]|nr:ABC transporter ATP-binding protein [Armatimonadota bacterium]MDR7451287.1 ABC transporter ATP-binding protein [Armatimonadota bacterium]MDR7466810.1 ABC transporter ATP-binding protein [Armatimonadota bacterium]MDR7492717.1 ABC transporter ATP-binding protein [Armatimonadota bacterium]MDR7499646.1 ABC transporter ATP-binding protein [Armatimonadota bacterium]
MLRVKGVSKRFGGLVVLRSVSFQVAEGAIVGLIGPNGSGKTTLFNVITGFHPPDAGDVVFMGRRLVGLAPFEVARAGIARTFQVVRPFTGLTTTDNVTAAVLYGRGTRDVRGARAEARRWLRYVGLEGAVDAPVHALTLGEKKRLELARALATGPRLLLLDEVFAGLNPVESVGAVDLVRRIRDELRITVLLVEHVIRIVMGLCERVVVLGSGQVIAQGPPAAVQADPQVRQIYLGEGFGAAG